MKFVITRSSSKSFFRQGNDGPQSMTNSMSDPAGARDCRIQHVAGSGCAFYKKRGAV